MCSLRGLAVHIVLCYEVYVSSKGVGERGGEERAYRRTRRRHRGLSGCLVVETEEVDEDVDAEGEDDGEDVADEGKDGGDEAAEDAANESEDSRDERRDELTAGDCLVSTCFPLGDR